MRTNAKLIISLGLIIVVLSIITLGSMPQDNLNNTTNNTNNNTTNITLNTNNTTNDSSNTTTQTKKTTTKTNTQQKKSNEDTVYFTGDPEASGEYVGVGEGVYKNKKTGNIYVQRGSNKMERDYTPESYYQ